ncbi:DEKNAAC100485 [Brettanomyces naardenensis]|uniref:Pre-mRNA-splicing factor SYF1 n=1 Tax=Brettanomyces naardenensis TaxID=13370 RepID=A0A448YGD8_BRENA|nr:DEKNAAC100485 [Brettanomyces naardenensis]
MSEGLLKYVDESDLQYEQELLKDPNDQEVWLKYIHHKRITSGAHIQPVLAILNRSVRTLSSSYKLWMVYIKYRLSLINGDTVDVDEVGRMVRIFQEASLYLNKFPYFWIRFLSFCIDYSSYIDVTFIRKQFDGALQGLPVIQHRKIWKIYLKFADIVGGHTLFLANIRYCEFKIAIDDSVFLEEEEDETREITEKSLQATLETLLRTVSSPKELDALSLCFEKLVSNPSFVVKLGKPELELYKDYFTTMIALVSRFEGSNVRGLDYRVGILHKKMEKRFPDQMGSFAVELAQYWIARKDFLSVISAFERGLANCLTLKDFTIIYDAYSDFEDSRVEMVSNQLEKLQGNEEAGELNLEINILLQRFEDLLARRPFLINDVYLRQDENDVKAWLDRIGIFDPEKDKNEITQCYQEALKRIDPSKVREPNLLSELWINYIDHVDDPNSDAFRKLYTTAVKVPFKFISDLEDVWCSWVNKEIAHGNYEHAVTVIKQAVTLPKNIAIKLPESKIEYNDEELSAQVRVHKSIKLWSLYLDLEESSDDFEATCKAYDRTLELKIATPLIVLNYCTFLEEHECYEQCFKVFERGVSVFRYPTVFEIWNAYLSMVIKYQKRLGIKAERVRDLFEQSLDKCPSQLSKTIYIMYAQFEETSGLKLQALRILSEAIDKVEGSKGKLDLYKMLILKTAEFRGIAGTSSVYQKALETLPLNTPGYIDEIVSGFVNTEAKQKRFTRCRQILQYSSELVMKHGRSQADRDRIWELFKSFELDYGDESTYKAMLRLKRHLEGIAKPIVEEHIEGAGIDFVHGTTDEKKEIGNNEDQIELDVEDLE